MKADNELYCWLLDWRERLEDKHNYAISVSDKGQDLNRSTFFSQFADEITETLAACDKNA